VTAVLAAALAEVDDLLAFEQRVHDRAHSFSGNGNLIVDAGPDARVAGHARQDRTRW
jgi:hypothetical protein